MGELVPLHKDDDADIYGDIFLGLNLSADDLGYGEDRIGWLRRLEKVLSNDAHAAYTEFTEGVWH